MIRWERGVPHRVRWNNVPYAPGRAAFLLNGKCGNTSVKTALLQAQNLPEDRPHRVTDVWSPAQVAASGYRAIGVVRNPYARAVSIWHTKIVLQGSSTLFRKAAFVPEMPFLDFLRVLARMDDKADTHTRAQWFTMYHRRRFLPDLVVKIEEPKGWDQVRAWMPEIPALPHRNIRGTPDWQPLIEGEAGDLIRRRYARDFELFGYPT
ncbi:MAG: sulfotransferase family 2 domain-containing protein [Pseudomonadota bacterium]